MLKITQLYTIISIYSSLYLDIISLNKSCVEGGV